jgi:dienelactone hydrolase
MRPLLLVSALVCVCRPAPGQEAPTYPAPDTVKAAFLKLLDRPKVPLDVKEGPVSRIDGCVLEHLSFAAEKKADGKIERVPTIVLRPEKVDGKLPAVIVLHGTGGSKDGQVPFMKELVKRGIIGVAIDARYHGARATGGTKPNAYNQAIIRAWQTKTGEPMEHPFYYDTCWDIWRTVDYLETRPDVDAKKLGIIGFSMGGIETWLAAAVDERLLASVPAIGVQSFRWSLDNDKWQGRAGTIKAAHEMAAKDLGESAINQRVCRELWSKVIPGILDQFDCPSMVRLFAGRPLLIVSGTKDGNCPYGGAKLAIESAQRAYKEADATDRLRVMVEEVGHTVTPAQRAAALEWFERWLVKEGVAKK